MNKSNLKQHLLAVIKELKEKDIKDYSNGVHKIIHDCRVHERLFDVNSFVDGLNLFLKEKSLNEHLAKKTIVMRYMKIINQLLKSETPSYLVNELLNKLEQETSIKKEFKVYVPLRGLSLVNNIKCIVNYNSQIICPDEILVNKLMPDINTKESQPVFIEQIIRGSDFLKAMEIAVESSKLIVHFLRYVDYHYWDEELLSLRLPGYGSLMEELRVIALPIDKDKIESYNWQLKEAQDEDLEIDDDFIEDAKDVGLERFGEILDNYITNSLNDMESQVLRSIVWFGESKIEHDPAARFLKLTLVLECLLNLNKSEPIATYLSERVAFILGKTLDERLGMVEKVKHLYDIRSRIVHNGSLDVEETDLIEIESIVAQLLALFLTNSQYSSLKTKEGLEKYN